MKYVSLFKEWRDHILNLLICELKVIPIELNELNLASLVERSKANVVLLIELSLLDWQYGAIGLKFVKPRSLFGIDHCVIGEHDQKGAGESGKTVVDGSGTVFSLLVVEVRQEHRVLEIVVEVAGVTEVACGANIVLNGLEVNKVINDVVNHLTE